MRNAPDDGFTLVTHKHRTNKSRKGGKHAAGVVLGSKLNAAEPTVPIETIVEQVERAQREIHASKFFAAAVRGADKALQATGHTSVGSILCYGLGRFSECTTARYQLAFLLAVRERYRTPVSLYDPLFSLSEQRALQENFSCQLIQENEEGKRELDRDQCTLVFAPHCPKQLTNNLLWANWGEKLHNCILLGNSFIQVIFNPTCLIESAQYILKISPFTTELALVNTFKFKDIFNDLAYHTFNTENVPEEFWSSRGPAPIYPADDTGPLIPRRDDGKDQSPEGAAE